MQNLGSGGRAARLCLAGADPKMQPMPRSPLGLGSTVEEYLNAQQVEHPLLADLARVTLSEKGARMQIAPSQASFMTWLLRLIGAKRVIEVGVYTGYSSLAMALALPADGYLLACDVSEEWTNIAREYWRRAGVENRIQLVLAPAEQTLRERLLSGESHSYDFVFLDADKETYGEYYELSLRLLRRGGIIAMDNSLWGGKVADRCAQDLDTRALREVNRRVLSDRRVHASLVPVGDGLLLATKR